MRGKPQVSISFRFLFSVSKCFLNENHKMGVAKTKVWPPISRFSTISASMNTNTVEKTRVWRVISRTTSTVASINENRDGNFGEEMRNDFPTNCTDVLRKWGCSDSEITEIFGRAPSLHKAKPCQIQSKLNVLELIGLSSSDLVKIIHCRPRFFRCKIDKCIDERIEFLLDLFGSEEMLRKAIVKNTSILIYDLEKRIKPVVELYKGMGFDRNDLTLMLISRPTMIARTSFDDDKLEYIRRTGLSKGSKLYKHVVVLMGISRLVTIREKVANLEKFGYSEDEVLELFGRAPLVLTLSVDKVQRNMTFVLGTMKISARTVIENPFLLFLNLEVVLKPRFLLGVQIEEMNIVPQIKGTLLLRALRMSENRFLQKYVKCHPEDLSSTLMEHYRKLKDLKRLAVSSKRNLYKGFPY